MGDTGLESTPENTGNSAVLPGALQMALQILEKLPPDRLAEVLAGLVGEGATK